jgi:hypothetical protein
LVGIVNGSGPLVVDAAVVVVLVGVGVLVDAAVVVVLVDVGVLVDVDVVVRLYVIKRRGLPVEASEERKSI